MRKRRAAMTETEREAHLAKRRATRKELTPEQKIAQSATLKRNYERRKASGICVSCTSRAEAGLYCMEHWFEAIGRNYGLTIKNGGVETLRVLWEQQGGICALTGEQLVPTQNATLDHILPQSRGGTHARSNLQWVTRSVNESKNDLTNEEFFELCRKVLRHNEETNVVALRRTG